MALSSILIVKLSSLGDVVHALPLAGAVRRRFPAAKITWVVGPAAAGVVGACRHLDRVLTWNPAACSRLGLLSALRSTQPQVSLDVQGLMRTTIMAWLSGARWRVGFRSLQEGGWPLCNLPAIPCRSDIHAVDAYLAFARYLGADSGAPDFGLALPGDALTYGDRIARTSGGAPMVALLPGTRWATKQWPVRHFAALAAQLGKQGVHCIVLGSAEDRGAGAAIAAASPHSVSDLSGRTSLAQSAGVMARCAAAVGNDSGATHLAAALGVPVVALFGPSDPVRTRPYGSGHVVLQARLTCLGCRRRTCRAWCMDLIRPETVAAAAQRLLRVRAGPCLS